MGVDGRESFEVWVRSQEHQLLRSTYLLTGDLHRAEDLVQDALIKVARRWSKLRDENPGAYIRRVIYRDHISLWRRMREVPFAAVTDEHEADRSGEVNDRLVMFQALNRLTPKQRAVVVLRYYDDLTEQQAAEVLGIGVGTVKSQTAAALARLRQIAPELRAVAAHPEDA